MSTEYNQNYTIEEIQKVLSTMQVCVQQKRRTFLFGESRKKNDEFVRKYQLRSNDIDKILLHLDVMDFVGTLESTNEKHQKELLYVFAPTEKLRNIKDKVVEIEIYIKFVFQNNNEKKPVRRKTTKTRTVKSKTTRKRNKK